MRGSRPILRLSRLAAPIAAAPAKRLHNRGRPVRRFADPDRRRCDRRDEQSPRTPTAAAKSKDSTTAAAAPLGRRVAWAPATGSSCDSTPPSASGNVSKPSTPLARSDRVLCLAPFRAQLALGKTKVDLIGDTEVRILSQAADPAPGLELIYGRVVLHLPSSSALKLGLTDKTATLEASGDTTLALERLPRREYGQSVTEAPPLVIYCIRGESSLSVDKRTGTLTPSDVLAVDGGGQVKRSTDDAPPAWAAETEPSPHELQVRDQFLKMFHPGRADLDRDRPGQRGRERRYQAVVDPGPQIARRSVALDADSLAQGRSDRQAKRDRGNPRADRAGPAAAARVKEQLVQEFGDDKAPMVEKMLIGFSADEASRPQLFELLVDTLAPEQEPVGVRELALDNLKRLTGRDDLGYDPDHPAEKGLNAWKDLQRQGKLRLACAAHQDQVGRTDWRTERSQRLRCTTAGGSRSILAIPRGPS